VLVGLRLLQIRVSVVHSLFVIIRALLFGSLALLIGNGDYNM